MNFLRNGFAPETRPKDVYTMPKDLKLFYFAFFLMRGRAKKILVFMIRNSSCKFDNVANVYV